MEKNLWAQWNPKNYLEEYHNQIATDTENVAKSLIEIFDKNSSKIDASALLDFGCGPTLYGVLPIGHFFKEIYLADHLSSNLAQIDQWVKDEEGSFNWNQHTQFILNQNGTTEPSMEQVSERENTIRKHIKSLLTCDARQPDPMGRVFRERFPVVVSLFCADSITNCKDEWKSLTKNIYSLVAPMGLFIVGTLLECQFYQVGGKKFPSANISAQDFEGLLKTELNCPGKCIDLKIINTPEHRYQGYEKFLIAVIQKSGSSLESCSD